VAYVRIAEFADFAPGTHARTRIEAFAYNYSALITARYSTVGPSDEYVDIQDGRP
jgi:hypothetical protein